MNKRGFSLEVLETVVKAYPCCFPCSCFPMHQDENVSLLQFPLVTSQASMLSKCVMMKRVAGAPCA